MEQIKFSLFSEEQIIRIKEMDRIHELITKCLEDTENSFGATKLFMQELPALAEEMGEHCMPQFITAMIHGHVREVGMRHAKQDFIGGIFSGGGDLGDMLKDLFKEFKR